MSSAGDLTLWSPQAVWALYRQALELALKKLPPKDILRICTAVNAAVFQAEVCQNYANTYSICHSAWTSGEAWREEQRMVEPLHQRRLNFVPGNASRSTTGPAA